MFFALWFSYVFIFVDYMVLIGFSGSFGLSGDFFIVLNNKKFRK